MNSRLIQPDRIVRLDNLTSASGALYTVSDSSLCCYGAGASGFDFNPENDECLDRQKAGETNLDSYHPDGQCEAMIFPAKIK